MAEIVIEIAGVAMSVVAHDDGIVDVIRDRYKGFLADRRGDWRLEMRAGSALAPSDVDVVVSRASANECFSVRRHDFTGTLDLRRRKGWVTVAEPDEIALDSFFRVAYSLALLEHDGLILHAASLVRRGRAHAFVGPSGSGKTTIAHLSPDGTLLSDELSILRVADGRVVAHGTPFWGDLARGGDNARADVAGVYLLRQGAEHAVEPLPRARALAALLPNVVFFARDALLSRRLLALASAVVEAVPCASLTFLRDSGFWEVLDA
jgi:hypothetical protein